MFEFCGGIIEFLQPNDGVVSSDRAPNLGAAGGRSVRTTNLDAPTRNLQYIKGKYADQPAKKKLRHPAHPPVGPVEPPWLQTAYF